MYILRNFCIFDSFNEVKKSRCNHTKPIAHQTRSSIFISTNRLVECHTVHRRNTFQTHISRIHHQSFKSTTGFFTKRNRNVNFKNRPCRLYLHTFSLKIKIKMCKICTAVCHIATARVRSTMGRYCFHRCLSSHTWGYLFSIP